MAHNHSASPDDRRIARRYPAVELKASLRVKNGLFNENWVPIGAVDYNRRGLAIETEVPLQAEESILLALELVMDMGSIQIEKLAAVIRYCQPRGNRYRYGIEFDFEGPRFMRAPEMEAQLVRIEGLLERNRQITSRIRSQEFPDAP